jgi:hypothetical protein
MNDIKRLFFNLTPDTLAAIVIELSDNQAMYWQRQAALDAGFDNCGDEFWAMLSAAADSRIQASSEPKFGDEVVCNQPFWPGRANPTQAETGPKPV